MLPALKKPRQDFQASQIKLYNPPRELTNLDNQQQSLRHSSQYTVGVTSSSRIYNNQTQNKNKSSKHSGGGFGGGNNHQKKDSDYINFQPYYGNSKQVPGNVNMNENSSSIGNTGNGNRVIYNPSSYMTTANNTKRDLNAEIKVIQKKIRYHQKKLEQDKKRKEEEERRKNDPYQQDFEKVVQAQMRLQGILPNEQHQPGFDYLTNPGKAGQQEQEKQVVEEKPQTISIQPQPIPPAKKPFNVQQKVDKLQRHYQNCLKKKFQRRQLFPHFACKRKTPKLYITQKTNALEKFGKRPPQEQHVYRVMTRECTPQQIYPAIPNFAVVKDTLSRNVVAYLGDYKPFVQKTRQKGVNMGLGADDNDNDSEEQHQQQQQERLITDSQNDTTQTGLRSMDNNRA